MKSEKIISGGRCCVRLKKIKQQQKHQYYHRP